MQGPDEFAAQSFVIRIWEAPHEVPEQRYLRGHITHVVSKESRYLKAFDDINHFIRKYFDSLEFESYQE